MFARWNSISDPRIAKNGWAFAPGDPALEEYSEIVSRHVRRVRVRLAPGKFRGHVGSESVPRGRAGNIIIDPSDDELPPSTPGEILLSQESFPVLGPEGNTTPNPNTPKRNAPDSSSASPGPKAPRVDFFSGL